MDEERVVIAEIIRSRGNRGELLANSLTDVPGRLETLKQANARLQDGSDFPVKIDQSWKHRDQWVLKFEGVDSIDAAERFRGADIWIPKTERGRLPEGEYFRSDLLGCTLRDQATGRDVGPVAGFEEYGGPLLLQVIVDGRQILVPFVPEICRQVDLETKSIAVTLPEGLLEL